MTDLPTPALLLDLDALEHNIATMIDMAAGAGIGLRPHGKSHKSPQIARILTEMGAKGTCCATLAELEGFAAEDLPGLLLTAPIATAEQIARLGKLHASGADVMVVADNPDVVPALSRIAGDRPLPVLVDCDVGQHRTGVADADAAEALARAITDAPGLTYAGVQAYWGHLQQVPDVTDRHARVKEAARMLAAILDRLAAAGLPAGIVTGGGTGTFGIDRNLGLFTELQPGSFLVLDSLYGPLAIEPDGTNPFRHALFVRAAVVSTNPRGNLAPQVTINAGLKAFATDSGLPRLATERPGTTFRYMGDEHGALTQPDDQPFKLGEEVDLIPSHCDPTVNLYPCYHLLRGGTLEGSWAITGRY